MKHKLNTTFGQIAFDCEITIDDAKAAEYAAKHYLFHVANSRVEKALGDRKAVKADAPTIARLVAEYAKAGVVVSNATQYVPAEAAMSPMVRATKLVAEFKAAGKLAHLAAHLGKLTATEEEMVYLAHRRLTGQDLSDERKETKEKK